MIPFLKPAAPAAPPAAKPNNHIKSWCEIKLKFDGLYLF